MTTTLITGANKGLGFETARRLIALGHVVYLGARDQERGGAAAQQLGARFVPIDVTDDASVASAAAWIEAQGTGLDVLINNAGIAGDRVAPADTTAEHMRRVYEANVFGIVRVTHVTLPLLRASKAGVIVNVSSGLGSCAAVTDPSRVEFTVGLLGYPSSKAAVTMLTVQYAKALPELRINAVDPGTRRPISTRIGAPKPSSREPTPSCVLQRSEGTDRRARFRTRAA